VSAAWRVTAYDDALAAALEEARVRGVFLIGRLEDRREWSALAQNGTLERAVGRRVSGLGLHVFTPAGHAGFASSDRIEPAEARQLVRRAASLAAAAATAGAESSPVVYDLRAEDHSVWPASARPLEATPPAVRRAALLEAHREASELATGLATRSSLSLVDDEWRVVRSDGTDVRFRMPRGVVQHSFTARGGGQAANAGCSVSGADDRVLLETANQARLRWRAARALRRARDAVSAAAVPSGSYRLVLDHTMAKSLAHEAFGHAVESDVAESSILATGGRLRLGERLARPGLSIVDGPLEGDFAYQPVSANGLRRQTVEVIRDGVLHSGLGDLFSAARAGAPVTGAARAESFRSRPTPRMSNIRLVLSQSAALDVPPESLAPADLAERLMAAGLLNGAGPSLYLAGWRGGQASPLLGDFVFNCAAIYDLAAGAAARQPAVFSGNSLSALSSIVGALGDLMLSEPGQCIKAGQAVPTSGGSHAFVVLEPHPEVTVGGG
jgi:TldD protein